MESDESVTFSTIVTAFTDFLTVAIHTILYELRQNRHPKVCQWIQDAVTAVESELLRSSVDRIALVILSPLQMPLERFVFEVSRFPMVKMEETSIPLERAEETSHQSSIINLQEQFRGAMSKLAISGGLLKPLPDSCSFTIAIETKQSQDPPIGHPQSFIPVQALGKKNHGPLMDNLKESKSVSTATGIVPVRTVETSDLHLEMWIEEVENKERSS